MLYFLMCNLTWMSISHIILCLLACVYNGYQCMPQFVSFFEASYSSYLFSSLMFVWNLCHITRWLGMWWRNICKSLPCISQLNLDLKNNWIYLNPFDSLEDCCTFYNLTFWKEFSIWLYVLPSECKVSVWVNLMIKPIVLV